MVKPTRRSPGTMMRFEQVFVDINGKNQPFNFKRVDEDAGGIWIISSGTKKLFVDDEFNFENFNMPLHWVRPAIKALKDCLP